LPQCQPIDQPSKNPAKDALFTVEDRMKLLREAVGDDPRVQVESFSGLLVHYAQEKGVSTILRGLRAVSDFEYEFQMANMNRKLDKKVETIFMMPKDTYTFLSSRIVKEIARLGGDVSSFVPPIVREALIARLVSASA